jgi:glycosyltransferase involved in cell wall biosynthesis
MNSLPAISIITPVWNGLPYIKECIESVLAQEFQDWELLLGDNGSTDGTREYLDSLKDSRIRVFKHEVNRGISGNLNFLFSKASAPLAYILCADDYFYPKGLTYVMDEWSSAPASVAFICFSPDIGHSKLRVYAYNILRKNLSPSESRLAFFLFGNFIGNLSNASVRVPEVNAGGGFSEKFKTALDFEMWSRLAKKHDVIISDKEVVFVREHLGAATFYMTQKAEDYGQLVAIYERLVEQLSVEYERSKLMFHFNTQITPQYFRTGIKYGLAGRFAFIKTVLNTKSTILWNIWTQLLICTPLALAENLREYVGIKSAQRFIEKKK